MASFVRPKDFYVTVKVIKLILHPLRKNNSELTKKVFKGSIIYKVCIV